VTRAPVREDEAERNQPARDTRHGSRRRASEADEPAERGSGRRHASSGRHLFTAVLVVFAVLMCVLWWRSREKVDVLVLFVGSDGRAQVLASSGGRVCIALTNIHFGRERAWTMMRAWTNDLPGIIEDLDVARIQIYPPADPAKVAAGGTPFGEGYLGFTFATSQSAVIPALPTSQLVYAILPHWAIAIPLVCWILYRLFGPAAERQRRLRKGQCVNCGYDLRASEGRCPECGAEIAGRRVPEPAAVSS